MHLNLKTLTARAEIIIYLDNKQKVHYFVSKIK